MGMLEGKKAIIIGDRDGIPGPAIEECVKTAGADVTVPMNLLKETTHLLSETKKALAKLEDKTRIAAEMSSGRDQAKYYYDAVCTAMEELRVPVDKLEMLVDKEEWPMPSYGDLLFEV